MSMYKVVVGDDSVSLKSVRGSRVVIIGVLGKEYGSDGQVFRIYLDSLVHSGDGFDGWNASGVVSTILTKQNG